MMYEQGKPDGRVPWRNASKSDSGLYRPSTAPFNSRRTRPGDGFASTLLRRLATILSRGVMGFRCPACTNGVQHTDFCTPSNR